MNESKQNSTARSKKFHEIMMAIFASSFSVQTFYLSIAKLLSKLKARAKGLQTGSNSLMSHMGLRRKSVRT